MVNTSNWPPLVAMSVVTRCRSTISSSVTHFTVMSGLALVNSLVRPCIRIMSPLLTVAIVSVVSANDGAGIASAAALIKAPRTTFVVKMGFTVSSLSRAILNICSRVELMFTIVARFVKRFAAPCSCALRLRAIQDDALRESDEALRKDGVCGGLVGDQAVDQPTHQRRTNRRDLCRAQRGGDRHCLCGLVGRNAGQAAVGASLDQFSLGVVGPAGDFSARTQPHHLREFLAGDEAIDLHLCLLVHQPYADQLQIGPVRIGPHFRDRIDPDHAVALIL